MSYELIANDSVIGHPMYALLRELVDAHHEELRQANIAHEGLVEYLVRRRPIGHFLTAVLSNDLTEACVRADPLARAHIADVVQFLANYAPANAWGSDKNVAAWLASVSEPVPELYE